MSSSTSRVLRGAAAAAAVRPTVGALPVVDGGGITPDEPRLVERDRLGPTFEMGYRDGFELGVADGRREGYASAERAARTEMTAAIAAAEQRLQLILVTLAEAAEDLRRRDALALHDVEADVVELAVQVTEAMLGRELSVVNAPVREAVRRSLALAPERGEPTIRVNPVDLEILGDVEALVPGRAVLVVADPTVEVGACLVDVGTARVDSQLGPALDRVRQALGAAAPDATP